MPMCVDQIVAMVPEQLNITLEKQSNGEVRTDRSGMEDGSAERDARGGGGDRGRPVGDCAVAAREREVEVITQWAMGTSSGPALKWICRLGQEHRAGAEGAARRSIRTSFRWTMQHVALVCRGETRAFSIESGGTCSG
jgi:hypothetical protein